MFVEIHVVVVVVVVGVVDVVGVDDAGVVVGYSVAVVVDGVDVVGGVVGGGGVAVVVFFCLINARRCPTRVITQCADCPSLITQPLSQHSRPAIGTAPCLRPLRSHTITFYPNLSKYHCFRFSLPLSNPVEPFCI